MALYTHVRNKSELLDLVANRIVGELDVDFDRSLPWQERIRRGIRAWAGLQHRHPRAFPLVYRSNYESNAVLLLTEELLDALCTAGFDERGASLAYQTVVVLVDGALLGRGTTTDRDLQTAWKRSGASVDPKTAPRYAALAPHAATLTLDEILESSIALLLSGLEEELARH
jgi:AcrR family transcriptional regulator